MRRRPLEWMKAWKAAIILLALPLAALPTNAADKPTQTRFQFETTPGYLVKDVRPQRYRLALDLDPARSSFDGKVSIDLRVTKPRESIEVHAFELIAGSATLVAAGTVGRPLRAVVQSETQSWRLEPTDGRSIPAGVYRLDISYSGKVQVAGEGLFVAPYTVTGKPQRMLATQLESINARRVFPAFDEPAFRAVFDLTVQAPKGYDVVSNMPRLSSKVAGDALVHHFAPTPAMPSYLFSVAVGKFEVLASKSGDLPLRMLVAPGKRQHAREALRATRDVLPWYAWYFNQPFALPKLDQLAVPSVRWGAMEDWGLISYAENNFLVDPGRSDEETRRAAYEVVAHEIAHQWFGNLVTAASWEEIWLNEAFATWLQNKASDRFNPGWKVNLRARPWIDRAMTLDAGAATRAIRSGPVRETAVNDVFDAITYAKGGAVLTMLEQWMGPATFRRGLVAYMKERRLSNATAADLWFHIGKASGRDVASVASSWTDQTGFPLVEASNACEAGHDRLTLRQSRFGYGASAGDQLWKIPVQLFHAGARSTVLLQDRQQTIDLGPCSTSPTLVNAGGQGFYRVAYDLATWQALTQGFAGLPEADRVTLLSDSFALMQAGRQPLSAHIDLLDALPKVEMAAQPILWTIVQRQLEFLDLTMAGSPAQQQIHALGRRLGEPLLARIGWSASTNEGSDIGELRGTLINLLARFDHRPTIEQALRAFDADQAGNSQLVAALREPVLQVTGMHADRARFDQLLAGLRSASGEEERWNFVRALAAGRDPARASELLEASLSDMAPANIASAIPWLVARFSPHGEAAYRYTLDHWAHLAELAGTWGRTSLLPNAAAAFVDPTQAQRLIDDQLRVAGADGDKPAAQQAEEIRLRAAVRSREALALEQQAAAHTRQ